jgi:hypothetical protein
LSRISRDSLLLAAVCTADTVITAALLATGYFTEANPLLAFYLQWGIGAMCGVKVLTFVVPIAIAEWYRHREPIFIARLLRITTFLYVCGYLTATATVNFAAVVKP